MNHVMFEEYLYLGIWSFVGSIIGFFAFVFTPQRNPIENLYRGFVSIFTGVFLAPVIYTCLVEFYDFSKHTNIILSGFGSFGLPDFIIKWWPKFMNVLAGVILRRLPNADSQIKSQRKTKHNTKLNKDSGSDSDSGSE